MNTNIINALIAMGLNEKESKVLSLLMDNKIVATRDFETLLDMRQPEVSLALKNLQARGWVRNGDKVKSDKMKRAGNTYELAMTIDLIVQELQTQYDLKQAGLKKSLKALSGK